MTVARLAPYVLAAVGLAATAASLQMTIWSNGVPQSGFFPLLASLLLVATSLACRLDQAEESERAQVGRLTAYMVLIILYCVLLDSIGFTVSTLLFLAGVFAGIERMGWIQALLLACIFAFCTWILFDVLLGVPLPQSAWRL